MKIHDLDLNEFMLLEDGTKILRVPDYWIYIFNNGSSQKIPLSNEFNTERKSQIHKTHIIDVISKYYNLPFEFYLQKNKRGVRPIAKKILIKILYENLNMIFEDIAILMRYHGHSTCSIAYNELNVYLTNNGNIKKDYDNISRKLKLNQ